MTLYEWCRQNIDSHTTHDIAILNDLEQFGITVQFKEDQIIELKNADGNAFSIWVQNWHNRFEALCFRGLPFIVLRDGVTEVSTEKYEGYEYLVAPRDTDPMQLGWIVDDEEARNTYTLSGADIAMVLAVLMTGEAPGEQYMGMGFQFKGNVEALKGIE